MDSCEIKILLDQCRTHALHYYMTTSTKTNFYITLREYESANTDKNRCVGLNKCLKTAFLVFYRSGYKIGMYSQ